MEFKKATLQEVSAQPSASPQPVGQAITVQINPATLRLALVNNVDMGKAFARPNTQYQGSSSSTLSFDLIFDTADEGTTETPVDVRDRTRQLERFLLPNKSSPKAVPPRVQFTYGTLTIVGVMSALNVDFDFFAANGVPLRAKCSVTIKEQKPEFDANLAGPGANTGSGATPPVPPSAGRPPGPPSPQDPDARTGTALDGESASDFANRMGLDPKAWKGLAEGLADPLRLEAGLQIDFSATLSVDAGLGVQVGATAGVSAGGADQRAPGDDGPVPAQAPASGPELTAQGGLSRALDRASVARTAEAATETREAFAPPEPAAVTAPAGPAAPAPPAAGAPPAGSGPSTTPSAPPAAVVTADPRATSYGFGVPLRERRGVAVTRTVGLVHERVRSVVAAPDDGVPETDDPTIPAWQALPAGTGAPGGNANGPHRKPRSGRGMGCGCGCGCSGGCASAGRGGGR